MFSITKVFLLLTYSVVSFRILLIGDSVDRYIVGDWCWSIGLDSDGSNANVWSSHWGANSGLQYGNSNSKKQPAFICGSIPTEDTIAFVHTFGSNPTGPYDMPVGIRFNDELYFRTFVDSLLG